MTADSMADPPFRLSELLGTAVDSEAVTRALHTVIDPELGVNIVDLGLVYDAALDDV